MQFALPNPQPMPPRLTALLLLALAVVVLASCTPRVYWPQGHGHRAALPTAPQGATVTVLEEGRGYTGWSPSQARCQQRPAFPSHSFAKK